MNIIIKLIKKHFPTCLFKGHDWDNRYGYALSDPTLCDSKCIRCGKWTKYHN